MAKAKIKKSFRDRASTVLSTIKSDMFRLGFSKVDLWASFGNYALNRIMSGSWDRGLLFGREYILFGESGSGKSYLSALVAADAQKTHNALVVWLDVEHANDDDAGQEWFKRAGLDISEDKFMYLSMATLEEIKKTIAKISVMYRDEAKEATEKGEELDAQPVVFVIDSWGAALTDAQMERAETGELKGDMGQKAKQLGDVILAVNHLCAGVPIMVLGVNHVYDNQDGYGPKHKTTGGNKPIFMASGCLMLTKKELKSEDVDDVELATALKEKANLMTADLKKNAARKTVGIISSAINIKSRVSKPFEKIEIQIPFSSGLDPYSGLFELLMEEGMITVPAVGWYAYKDAKGNEVKFRKAEFRQHADLMMKLSKVDISSPDAIAAETVEAEGEEG